MANIKATNNQGISALHLAAFMNNLRAMDVLTSKGESLLNKGKAEIDPLHALYESAIEKGKIKWKEIIETAVAHLNMGAFNDERNFNESLINSLKINEFWIIAKMH